MTTITHGLSATRIYSLWCAMKRRIFNERGECFKNYGGRGLDMDPRWRKSVVAFYLDMGDPPTSKHMLERIDNNRGYWPDNCKWATRHEQMSNRRNNVVVTLHGEDVCRTEAERRLGVKEGRLNVMARQQHLTPQEATDILARRFG